MTMPNDAPPTSENDLVDPWLTDLLGPLVQLVGSVNQIDEISELLTISVVGDSVLQQLRKRLQSRQKAVAAAIKGMQNGLGRTQAALQSLATMPDISELEIPRRRIGFLVRKTAFHAYKISVADVHRGLEEVAKHAEAIWKIRDELPEGSIDAGQLSDDAAKLTDRLGDALKTLAGSDFKPGTPRVSTIRELMDLARSFCEHAQSKLDKAERLSFEQGRE